MIHLYSDNKSTLLCRHAEGVYDKLSQAEQQRAKRIFLKLVSPGEGTEYTRKIATRDAVGEENWDLVTHLATARLVVSNRNETTQIETVEIVHEALIKAWPNLKEWIEENDVFLRWEKRLEAAFLEWEKNENKEGYLLQGAPLGEAEGYLQQRLGNISAAQRVFINLSLEQEKARQQRELEQERKARKAAQRLTIGAMIASVILGGVGIFAFLQAREANVQRLESEKQKTEAQSVTSKLRQLLADVKEKNHLQRKENESKSLNWAKGVKFSPNGKLIAIANLLGFVEIWSQDGSFVRKLDSQSPYSPSFSPDSQMLVATDLSIDKDDSITLWKVDGTLIKKFKGHRGHITCVSFSPDGKFIASAGKDGMIKFWKLDGNFIKTIKAHTNRITSLSFSPDGKIIASASNDNTIKLWKTDGILFKKIDTIEPNSVSFSPNGKIIASGSTKETNIKLWSSDGNLLKIFPKVDPKLENSNSRVSFSPDGKMLVSTGFEPTVNLWSIDGKFLRDIEGHNSYRVWDASFSPDGKTLATAATDGSVKLWDMDRVLSEKKVGVLPEILKSDEPIAGFSPDGQIFASVNNDYSINVRNLNGSLISILRGHKKKILSLNFSLDSKLIISTDENRIIKIWNRNGDLVKDFTLESLKAKAFPVQGHKGFNQITRSDRGVMNIRFSPDGKMFASAGSDGNVKLWNQDGSFVRTVGEINGVVAWVSFSPDGMIVVSGNDNGTINLWNTDGTLIKTLDVKSDVKYSVNQVGFSPDGTMFVSAQDKTIKLWKRDGTLINTFTGHSNFVYSVVFSPDGKTIASASADKTVKLWNLNGTELKTLKGHSAQVLRVSFSPDGKTIASASADKTVKLWNVNGKEMKTLQGYNYGVIDIKFSPDGQTIASVDLDSFRLQKIDGTLLKIIKGPGFNLTSVDFTPDGKLIAVNSENGTVKFLDKQGNLLRFSILAAESVFRGTVRNATFSPDIQNIQIIDNLGFMSLWSFDGILRNSLFFGSGFFEKSGGLGNIFAENPTFSNDGSMIASATSGSEIAISLWNREGTLLNKLNNPGASIVTMKFSPDGKFLVWSSMDNTIGLWKIDGSFRKTFKGHSRVLSISFSPDGKTIALGSSDGTVKLWDLDGNLAATLIGYGKPIQYVSFNPDGKTLIAYDGMRVFGGSLDIDDMLVRGCSYLHDYLNNKHDSSEIDRHLCDGISNGK